MLLKERDFLRSIKLHRVAQETRCIIVCRKADEEFMIAALKNILKAMLFVDWSVAMPTICRLSLESTTVATSNPMRNRRLHQSDGQ